MSDTPRTDNEAEGANWFECELVVHADFARQLERELAEANKDKARLGWLQKHAEVHVSTAKEGADILSFNAWLNEGDDLRQKIDYKMPLDQWDRDNIDDEINREENQNEQTI